MDLNWAKTLSAIKENRTAKIYVVRHRKGSGYLAGPFLRRMVRDWKSVDPVLVVHADRFPHGFVSLTHATGRALILLGAMSKVPKLASKGMKEEKTVHNVAKRIGLINLV